MLVSQFGYLVTSAMDAGEPVLRTCAQLALYALNFVHEHPDQICQKSEGGRQREQDHVQLSTCENITQVKIS